MMLLVRLGHSATQAEELLSWSMVSHLRGDSRYVEQK